MFVRAIELNTLVDGVVTPTDYKEPVELVFVLTEADLELVDGDTSRVGVLWFNEETREWESIEVTYEDDPPPAGSLVVLLNHFSVYAIGVMEETEPEEQQVAKAVTAAPTPAPRAVPTATSLPIPTARAVATSTSVPANPTAIAVAHAAPTPVSSEVPLPTATVAPPVPAVPVAPATLSRPLAEPETSQVGREPGGIDTTSIVILIVLGVAVLTVIAVVAWGLRVRRREL